MKRLTDSDRGRMLSMYRAGTPATVIAEQFHVTASYPNLLARRNGLATHGQPQGLQRLTHATTGVREDAERLMLLIPVDTRDLTGRLMGDPLPGRSALSAR